MTGLPDFHRLAATRGDPRLVDPGAMRDTGVTQAKAVWNNSSA